MYKQQHCTQLGEGSVVDHNQQKLMGICQVEGSSDSSRGNLCVSTLAKSAITRGEPQDKNCVSMDINEMGTISVNELGEGVLPEPCSNIDSDQEKDTAEMITKEGRLMKAQNQGISTEIIEQFVTKTTIPNEYIEPF